MKEKKNRDALTSYGVEIECIQRPMSIEDFHSLLEKGWKVKGDGTIKGDFGVIPTSDETYYGSSGATYSDECAKQPKERQNNSYAIEWNSPVFYGRDEVNKGIDEMTRILRKNKPKSRATVNKTCGLHVHIQTSQMRKSLVKRIVSVPQLRENLKRLSGLLFSAPALYYCVSKSRRGNKYCKPYQVNNKNYSTGKGVYLALGDWKNLTIKDLIPLLLYGSRGVTDLLSDSFSTAETTKQRDAKMLNEYHSASGMDDSHYSCMSYAGEFNTIEIRLHQGTINRTKIKNWVYLLDLILTRSQKMTVTQLRNYYSKIQDLYDVVLEKQGSHYKEDERVAAQRNLVNHMFKTFNIPEPLQTYYVNRQIVLNQDE